jgi:hypothetical protein
MKDADRSRQKNTGVITGRNICFRSFVRPRSLDHDPTRIKPDVVALRLTHHRIPQIVVGTRPCQSNSGPGQRRNVFHFILQFVVGEFAGCDLPDGAGKQENYGTLENDFDLFHNTARLKTGLALD